MPDQQDIRAVIFDMDGVLTDSEPLINAAAVAMFRERGLAVQPEDFAPFVGAGEDRYLGGVAEKYSFALDLADAKRRTYEIYLEMVPKRLERFPGAVELVEGCRRAGLRVAVASSADRVKVEANLRQIGLPWETWDAVVAGEDVAAKKPAPDIFLVAAGRLGVAPGCCVVVEDAVNGVRAAKAAGMRCVAVAQTFGAERLQEADLVRPTIAQATVADLAGRESPPPLPPCAAAPPVIPARREEGAGREESGGKPLGFWTTLGLGLVAGGAFVGVQAGVAVVFMAVSVALGREAVRENLESNGLLLALAATVSAPVVALFCWLFARIPAPGEPGRYLGFKRVPVGQMAWWGVALLGMAVLSDLLTTSLGRPIVPEFMQRAYASAGVLPLFWLGLVVAAPVGEEILFRGFLFEGWRQSRVGGIGAILLTSAVWSAIHLQYDFYGVATIFVAGLLLGWARLSTGSVYTTMVLHGLMNLIATLQTAWL
ncbi:MAG TPA: HAD-IA family hydrolase [Candidatus Paceibacterota bacterium]|nr:HAD-IA family hydrolase [Candidatus Paceibacterota bacterium]